MINNNYSYLKNFLGKHNNELNPFRDNFKINITFNKYPKKKIQKKKMI